MFKEMRRTDRKLDEKESKKILDNGEYGTLSVLCENNYPYGIPLSYVYYDDAIYFHCALEGQKLDAIKNNSKVSFCVVGKTKVDPEGFTTKYESTIVFGEAVEVIDEEKVIAFIKILEKYSKAFLEKGKQYIDNAKDKTKIFKIRVEKLSGKGNY